MKKSIFSWGIISTMLVIGLSLAGCASTKVSPDLGTYDPSVTEDQLVTLEIAGGLKVNEFNGVKVSWGPNGIDGLEAGAANAMKGGNKYKTTIRIPPGNHTLQANLYLWDYNNYPGVNVRVLGAYRRATGLEISHDFQPGHTYFLRPVLILEQITFKNLDGQEVEVQIFSLPSLLKLRSTPW